VFALVTVNIRFDNPNDGENRWANRRSALSALLRRLEPELIATQEGWHRQIEDLDADLPDHRLVDGHRDWIEDRMYPCIFYRESRVRLLESGDVWLSETPDAPGSSSFGSSFPRLATWARVAVDSDRYLVANMHLDNSTDLVRRSQSHVASTVLADRRNERDYLILMGDFNEAPGGGVANALGELGEVYDPWIESDLPDRGSYHAFAGESFEYDRIDWILLDRRLGFESIELDCSEIDGRYPSDHFPVVCRGVGPAFAS
jgi:endonuclease/exonuclease/phosphatase family metal-dependent hydrolase